MKTYHDVCGKGRGSGNVGFAVFGFGLGLRRVQRWVLLATVPATGGVVDDGR